MKRIAFAFALSAAASMAAAVPAAAAGISNFNFAGSAPAIAGMLPDVCIPLLNYCITWTNSTMISGIANATNTAQIGQMGAQNLLGLSGQVIGGNDIANLASSMSALNSQWPSVQGTALAAKIAQANTSSQNLQTVQSEMNGAQGSLEAQQAQGDGFQALGEEINQSTQLQAAQAMQQQSDVASADDEEAQDFDLGGTPTSNWSF